MATDLNHDLRDHIFRLILEFSDSYFRFKQFYEDEYSDNENNPFRVMKQLLAIDNIARENLDRLSQCHRNFERTDNYTIANITEMKELRTMVLKVNENLNLIHDLLGTQHNGKIVVNETLNLLDKIPVAA